MEINKVELYHGECLQVMDSLIEQGIKVDMILCDLPYGVTKNDWDKDIIPLIELWERYNKIIKDNGAIVLFGQDKFTTKLMMSNIKNHRYNLIWEKDRPSGFLNAKRMPLRSHEDICIFYKKQPVYNPQMTEGKPNHSTGRAKGKSVCKNNNYGDFTIVETSGNLKYPRSVLRFNRPHPPVHPTQKPVDLLEYLIKTYTNENDVVLDNCMGSGSTGVACVNTNRRFVGIEVNEEYLNIACDRIKQSQIDKTV